MRKISLSRTKAQVRRADVDAERRSMIEAGMNRPDPPKNSQIQIKSGQSGVTLYWKKPNGGPFRLFLIVWLGAWIFGFIAVGNQLLSGDGQHGFLAFWLAGWTLGGLFAGLTLYLRKKQNMMNPFAIFFQKRRTYEFSRAECPRFILEGMGRRTKAEI
jgi:hypothetical protein